METMAALTHSGGVWSAAIVLVIAALLALYALAGRISEGAPLTDRERLERYCTQDEDAEAQLCEYFREVESTW